MPDVPTASPEPTATNPGPTATAPGANNGGLTLWLDGVQQADLSGIDNDTGRIDRVAPGPLSGLDAGTSGREYFDAFESRRQGYIGPLAGRGGRRLAAAALCATS
ncbi:MAG: hypothetical protein HY784_16820 [Chloroflexi bacterium]|nr:hypothetical protein [Chloroflexota bacterium]